MTAADYRDDGMAQLRMPPQAMDAEQSVLGGLMLAPDAWPKVCDLLTEGDFYAQHHQLIWRAIDALAGRGRPFDAVTLGEFFESRGLADKVSGGAYLIELASTTPSAANIVAYAEIVGEKSRMRRAIDVGTTLVNDGFLPEGREVGEVIADAQSRLAELLPAQRGGLRRVSESLPAWYDQFVRRYDTNTRMTGIPTPWSRFNEVTHGLQPATLYLLAARPSMGKSIVGLNLAMFCAIRGKTAGLFSLEMGEIDCHNRNISALAQIPHDWVIAPTSDLDDGHLNKLSDAMAKLKSAPLFIDDTPSLTARQFEARARRMHQRDPLDVLVIDHVHDFKIDPRLARFEYGVVAQTAKNLGKEWGIPVVALAQLNRNLGGRTDKRPIMADLRESGELEQKADVIAFLHREDYYDTPDEKTHMQGVVEMHFAKGRNIRSGERIYLRNRFDQMRVEDWEGPLPKAPPKKQRAATVGYGGDDASEPSGKDRAAGGW